MKYLLNSTSQPHLVKIVTPSLAVTINTKTHRINAVSLIDNKFDTITKLIKHDTLDKMKSIKVTKAVQVKHAVDWTIKRNIIDSDRMNPKYIVEFLISPLRSFNRSVATNKHNVTFKNKEDAEQFYNELLSFMISLT